MVGSRRSEEVVDPNIEVRPSTRALKRALLTALRCVDPDSEKRPKMGQVVRMLESEEYPIPREVSFWFYLCNTNFCNFRNIWFNCFLNYTIEIIPNPTTPQWCNFFLFVVVAHYQDLILKIFFSTCVLFYFFDIVIYPYIIHIFSYFMQMVSIACLPSRAWLLLYLSYKVLPQNLLGICQSNSLVAFSIISISLELYRWLPFPSLFLPSSPHIKANNRNGCY